MQGLVLLRPFKTTNGVGTCLRVSCYLKDGRSIGPGEIPLAWFEERAGFYDRRGLNATETAWNVLQEWEQVTTQVQEN